MKKRRTVDEVARLLRAVDRDLAAGLAVSDACRKLGIAETTDYRWRRRRDLAVADADRRRDMPSGGLPAGWMPGSQRDQSQHLPVGDGRT
jgi:hypothetical protein